MTFQSSHPCAGLGDGTRFCFAQGRRGPSYVAQRNVDGSKRRAMTRFISAPLLTSAPTSIPSIMPPRSPPFVSVAAPAIAPSAPPATAPVGWSLVNENRSTPPCRSSARRGPPATGHERVSGLLPVSNQQVGDVVGKDIQVPVTLCILEKYSPDFTQRWHRHPFASSSMMCRANPPAASLQGGEDRLRFYCL